jgi:hypothetical protein
MYLLSCLKRLSHPIEDRVALPLVARLDWTDHGHLLLSAAALSTDTRSHSHHSHFGSTVDLRHSSLRPSLRSLIIDTDGDLLLMGAESRWKASAGACFRLECS